MSAPEQHPAISRIRAALQNDSFTSGTAAVSDEALNLFYRASATDTQANVLNLAKATPEQLDSLISACDAAPFGRGNQTVMDDTYRKALKLELAQFAMPFELSQTGILTKIRNDLVNSSAAIRHAIRAEPYKLNIYDKGSFFKAHKDTPRDTSMFGSLVIIFPTEHEGGNLILTEGDEQWDFDAPTLLQQATAPSIAWVAFYSTIVHEVLPVISGARVTLTYNLYFKGVDNLSETACSPNSKLIAVQDSLRELVDEYEDGHLFAFGLAYEYPLERGRLSYSLKELKQFLKGSDALVYAACKAVGLSVSLKLHYEDQCNEREYISDWSAGEPDEEVPVEDESIMYEGMEDLENVEITWVTAQTNRTGVETLYIAYGNQASLSSVYGRVFMLAWRSKADSDSGSSTGEA